MMPLPVFVSGMMGAATGQLIGMALGSTVQPHMRPTQRGEVYRANASDPNTVPSFDAAIDAWSKGRLSLDHLIRIGLLQGITVGTEAQRREALNRDNTLTPAQRTDILAGAARYRFGPAWWGAIADSSRAVPDISTVYSARNRGIINEGTAGLWTNYAKGDPEVWNRISQLWESVPTIGPLYEARWRGIITPQRFDYWLTRNGFADPEARRILGAGLEILPPISDLLRFSHKEAFAPEVAGELGFYEEFPTEAQQWIEKQGMSGGPGFTGSAAPLPEALAERLGIVQTPDPAAPGRVIRQLLWLDMYNAAEWQPISPSQSYEMLHRLRPGATARFDRALGLPEGSVKAFTQADVFRWLRIADYPTSVRNQLAAISYGVMRLIDIRAVYRSGLQGQGSDAWASGQLLDRGYTPDDAALTVRLWRREQEQGTQKAALKAQEAAQAELIKQAREGYALGIVSETQLRDSLASVQVAPAAIDLIVSVEGNKANIAELKGLLARIRSDIRSGVITEAAGRKRLEDAGFRSDRAGRYARQAALSITARRQQVTTGQILKWVGEGTLPPAQAAQRLANIGWTQPDIVLLLRSAAGTLRQLQARQITQAQGAARKNARGLAQVRKESIALQRQVETDLRRIQPIAQIKKLLGKGIITNRTAIARLLAQGYPPQAVAEYLALWKGESSGKSGEAQGETGTQAPSAQPGTSGT
jgi:hypothetical protein